jgi:hypothetical protein
MFSSNGMKNIEYYTIRTDPIYNRKISEREAKSIPATRVTFLA